MREKSCGAVIYKKEAQGYVYLIEHMSLGHISLPKGHMEKDETEEETALREIFEETGLRVILYPSFRQIISYAPYKDHPEIIKDVLFFLAETKQTEIPCDKHDNEVIFSEFLPFADAYQKLTYATDKTVLKKAAEFLKDMSLSEWMN